MIAKQSVYPAELVKLRNRFESWRQKKSNRSEPIPEALWASAVSLARNCGLNTVATALRLEYYSLKKRVEAVPLPSESKKPETRRPLFVELSQPVMAPECYLEFENPNGTNLKVQFKGATNLDLVALGQAFWRNRS
jgi:hypothetical protein